MKYKKYDYDSYQVYTIQTDKFKNCYMEVNFRDDIREVNTARRSFLTELLVYTSLNYPTKRDMIIEEEELYNLYASAGCYRVGNNLCSNFSIDILNPKYVKEKDYLDNVLKFCFDILLHPHVEKEKWNERSFEIIRERIHTSIDQYKESPLSYAAVESRKILFSDSFTGKRMIGTHEEIECITREDLYEEYKSMFQNSSVEILIIGDLNMDEVVKKISKYFYKASIVKKDIPLVIENKISSFESRNVTSKFHQTQLIEYYQFPTLSYFEKHFVFPLFQKIFGSSSLSDKLGKYLRMENSLCYSYGFQYFLADNYATVITQLKKENVKIASDFIKKAMDEMKNGDITEEEFNTQKNKMLSDLKLREDSIYGLIENYYYHEVYGAALFDEYYTEILSVKIGDIKKLANKLQKTFQYVLEEDGNEGN